MSDGDRRHRGRRDDRQAHRRRGRAARSDRAGHRRRPRRPRSSTSPSHTPPTSSSSGRKERGWLDATAHVVRRRRGSPRVTDSRARRSATRATTNTITDSRSRPSVRPIDRARCAATSSTRRPQRRLGNDVGDPPALGCSGASRSRHRRTAARRHSTRSAGGSSSRNPQIVNASRRSWMTGARPNSDARRNAMPRQPRTASSTRSPGCSRNDGRSRLASLSAYP